MADSWILDTWVLNPNSVIFFSYIDATSVEQQDLFCQKLQQCCVLFDFMDSVSDLRSKEIKRATLNELVEYVSTNRGVIVESSYSDIVKMVSKALEVLPFLWPQVCKCIMLKTVFWIIFLWWTSALFIVLILQTCYNKIKVQNSSLLLTRLL